MATSSDSEGIDKVANLLALLIVKDMTKSAASSVLSAAGFTNKEIAALLGTTEDSVRSYVNTAKRKLQKPEKSADG